MKIGVHKLGFESINFKNRIVHHDDDKNGMLTEVLLLLEAFRVNGYKAEYVKSKSIKKSNVYDKIFLFNGRETATSNINLLSHSTRELNYILTDSRLLDHYGHASIDNFFVQSHDFNFVDVLNGNTHLLPVFERKYYNPERIRFDSKNGKLIFGGSVRNRREKFDEYLFGNKRADLFIKDEEAGYDFRLPTRDYKMLLDKYTFGLVMIDAHDVFLRSITWRYYEYIANNVLTFVEVDSDPNNLLLEENSFMYVRSKEEMDAKMNQLLNDVTLRESILTEQRSKMNDDAITGKLVVDSLLRLN